MSLSEIVSKAWETTKDNLARKRYLAPGNYISDIVAGVVSRNPWYVVIDTMYVGTSVEKAVQSVVNGVGISLCGWNVVYTLCNSLVAEGLGEVYTTHKKKIDALYSSSMTFGFGMVVNLSAGYTSGQAITASVLRAAVALPLGPITRYYIDAFRESRGEPSITPEGASFAGKGASYSVPRVAAMMALPVTFMLGALWYHKESHPQSIQKIAISQQR